MSMKQEIRSILIERVGEDGCEGETENSCGEEDGLELENWCSNCLISRLMVESEKPVTKKLVKASRRAASELRWWHDQPGTITDSDVAYHADLGVEIAAEIEKATE